MTVAKPVHRLFIANRGEIARRIATTAKRLGIETVAITKHTVAPGYLTGLVDHWIVMPDETSQTYLQAALMIQLAKQSGCDALHPGFGFLSENADFAAQVQAAGLNWIGPSPKAIQAMASKEAARKIAEQAKVPVVPALADLQLDAKGKDKLVKSATAIGFPLLIKAALGGGGKGMRLVHQEADLLPMAQQASSEALSAFGDGSILIEKYLNTPRHIEVQVFGDQHGNVVAVGDRDCSVQRRHQKIIEEAPAPGLTTTTRQQLHEAAVRLAKTVGYSSAGTVEFLLDWSPAAKQLDPQRFYFLEMNTRLQVEHPVTEEVFGLDLVEWQLRVAQGENLPAQWQQLTPRGHSIEVRIYAEDVSHQFFPSPGVVEGFLPTQRSHVRWEIGLDPLDEVSTAFDPMVAKLVTTGQDRATAISMMREALADTALFGPATNIGLLHEIFSDPLFQQQPVSTHYIQEHLPRILAHLEKTAQDQQKTADRILNELEQQSMPAVGQKRLSVQTRTQEIFGQRAPSQPSYDIILNQDGHYTSARLPLYQLRCGRGMVKTANGSWQGFQWSIAQHPEYRQVWCKIGVSQWQRRQDWGALAGIGQAGETSTKVSAPVPGKVKRIMVDVGTNVQKHQTVVVLESMKMEFEVQSPREGIVAAIHIAEGMQVNADDLLLAWQEHP